MGVVQIISTEYIKTEFRGDNLHRVYRNWVQTWVYNTNQSDSTHSHEKWSQNSGSKYLFSFWDINLEGNTSLI